MNAFRRLRFYAWLAVVVAAVLLDATLQAQGVFNANNNYTPVGAAGRAFITDWTGRVASRHTTRIAFLGPDNSYLTPNGSAGVPLAADGLFYINGVTVPGVPIGGTVQIVVLAWDISTGSTFDDARVRASVNVVLQNLGGTTRDHPPATFALNSNFTGLSLAWPVPPMFRIDRVFNGTASIISVLPTESLVIPSNIAGFTITRILGDAFLNRHRIVELVLPDTLVELAGGAFSGFTAVRQITLPSRVTVLPDETFRDCRSLLQLHLPSGIRTVGSGAFRNCASLLTLQLPETVEELGTEVFAGTTALRSVRFTGPPPRVAGPLGLPADAVIEFLPTHPGWGETFQGVPTRAWLPSLQIGSGTAGGGSMRMTVDWAEGQTVVLEGSESLGSTDWSPLSTHRLLRQPLELTVPIGETAASRFFRVSPATSPTESPDPQTPR